MVCLYYYYYHYYVYYYLFIYVYYYVHVDSFWKRVKKEFYDIMGKEKVRTIHQITSKCGSIKTKVSRFAAIYNNEFNKRGSGMSDGDILLKAHIRYSQEVGAAFNHEHCWQLVKDSPQWTTVPTMSSDGPMSRASKRIKTWGTWGSCPMFLGLGLVGVDSGKLMWR